MKKLVCMMLLICASFVLFAQTIPTFDAADTATTWVYKHITYCLHASTLKESQTPGETLAIKSGNCTDMSRLLVAILLKSGADPANVLYIGCVNSEGVRHMTVQYMGIYFECTNGTHSYSLPDGFWEFVRYPANYIN